MPPRRQLRNSLPCRARDMASSIRGPGPHWGPCCFHSPPPRTTPARAARHSRSRALDHIHGHLGERLPLEDLAAIARLSVFRFATVFRQRVGESPHRYICRLRVERAQALLRDGMPAAIVATETGFYDQSHLSRHFKSVCGMTPGQYLTHSRAAPEPRLVRAA